MGEKLSSGAVACDGSAAGNMRASETDFMSDMMGRGERADDAAPAQAVDAAAGPPGSASVVPAGGAAGSASVVPAGGAAGSASVVPA